MIGRCEICRRFRWDNRLPSGWDRDWLNGGPMAGARVLWTCADCAIDYTARGNAPDRGMTIERYYLMPLRHVLPFMGTIAVLVMTCLEIAWHT